MTTLPTVPPVSRLRRMWNGWKRIAHRIGNFQARVLLTVVYFVVITPFALAVRWGADPLALKSGAPRGWLPRPASDRHPTLDTAGRQS